MIALFDSGFGGLTVLKPIMELLPDYDYLYLGDNRRAPYGSKSHEHIKKFSEQATEHLFAQGAKLIIFACNTASSVALRHIQQKYLNGKDETERKVLGVLIPVAEAAARAPHAKIGIVGTKATINSHSYPLEIAKLSPDLAVHSKTCPLLVPFIEENWHHKPEAVSILKKYLRPLKSKQVSSLILGCTHYPFMTRQFRRIMGPRVQLLESGPITAHALQAYLQNHPEIETKLTKNRTRTFQTTGDPQAFQTFAHQNLGMKIKMPERVEL